MFAHLRTLMAQDHGLENGISARVPQGITDQPRQRNDKEMLMFAPEVSAVRPASMAAASAAAGSESSSPRVGADIAATW
ncbi:hypothetical protein [Achromobacter mucicolens]|uniref:hypothetical protein n=1 Tax=Achromobacter mucicolens TaxID=1389922 RepID=UPI00289C9A71|nr:hypothetical protein [Achromobacter mucicolens]